MREYRIQTKNAAKGIRRGSVVDPFFGSRYSFSPYQGCVHGCLYCDGRAEKYFMDDVFDSQVGNWCHLMSCKIVVESK